MTIDRLRQESDEFWTWYWAEFEKGECGSQIHAGRETEYTPLEVFQLGVRLAEESGRFTGWHRLAIEARLMMSVMRPAAHTIISSL